MIEAGKEYECEFSIDDKALNGIIFHGNLKITTSNIFKIVINENDPEAIKLFNLFNGKEIEFKLNGSLKIDNNTTSFISLHSWYSSINLIRTDLFVIGKSDVFDEQKIKSCKAIISGYNSNNKPYRFNINSKIEISLSNNYIEFISQNMNLDDYFDYIASYNDFMTLITNIPSVTKSVSVTDTSGNEFQVFTQWLPYESRNKNLAVDFLWKDPQSMINSFKDFLTFCNSSKIATLTYFTTQTLNERYFEQMILYQYIFCFEGFWTSFADKQKSLKRTGVSSNVHKKIRDLLNPHIDSFFDKSECKEILKEIPSNEISEYIDNIKNGISYSNDLTFRKRIEQYLSLHQEIVNKMQSIDKDFVDKLINFRNTFAHNTDGKLQKIQDMDVYKYVVVLNCMIRTLLIKDVLGYINATIPMEQL